MRLFFFTPAVLSAGLACMGTFQLVRGEIRHCLLTGLTPGEGGIPATCIYGAGCL